MTAITTRAGKGSPLTNSEIDGNFTNLNQDKLEIIVSTTASAASLTPAATDTQYSVTALAVDANVAAPSGTPVNSKKLIIRIKDDGTSRTLSWNAIYRVIGVTLPLSTTVGKTIYVGCVYNSADTKWDVIASVVEG